MSVADDALPQAFSDNPERSRSFVPTPEQLSTVLGLKQEEVEAQLHSQEDRQKLYEQLLQHGDELAKQYPDFHPEHLQLQLAASGEALTANKRFTESLSAPEKQGLLSRAWSTVKKFPRNHPVVTGLLGLAALAGGVAGGLYLAGYWETVMAYVGASKILGLADAAAELAPITPDLPPVTGAGPYGIPPPTTPPGGWPVAPY